MPDGAVDCLGEATALTDWFEYFAVVGFAPVEGVVIPVELTYVNDPDLVDQLVSEATDDLCAVAAYRLTPLRGGPGYDKPVLVGSVGRLPPGWRTPSSDAVLSVVNH